MVESTDDKPAPHIWELFRGYEEAHGRYTIKRTTAKGKQEGPAGTIRGPATQALWDAHLAGMGAGLGIVPLLKDNTVVWGCVDIDEYGVDLVKLEARIKEFGFPLVICRTKSGGAHCYLFMQEPVEAKLVIDALHAWAASLGYGGCEIFPKQSLRYDEDDVGNWLNMPYYHADRTSRYCLRDGVELSLAEFCEYAASKRVSKEQLAMRAKPMAKQDSGKAKGRTNEVVEVPDDEGGLFEQGPPCLQILQTKGGFPDGTRNEGMFNVAVYLRKRYPDDWKDKIQEYNVELCEPTLELSNINATVKSVERKEYDYKCKKPPIVSYCNKRLCRTRQFGVGEMAEGGQRPEISELKKIYAGEDSYYIATVNDTRITFTLDELLNQQAFKRKIAHSINRVPRSIPADRWDKFLDDLIRDCEVDYLPIDATPFGQFVGLLDMYLRSKSRTTDYKRFCSPGNEAPYVDGTGKIMFKLRGLIRFLDSNGFRQYKKESELGMVLRRDPINAESKQVNIGKYNFRCWIVDEPGEESADTAAPNFGTEEF